MKPANAVILYDNFIRNIALNSQIRGKNRDKIRIIKLKKMLGIQMHHQNGFYPIAKKGPSTIHYVSKIDNPIGTIPILYIDPYITSAKGLGGWGQKNGNFC